MGISRLYTHQLTHARHLAQDELRKHLTRLVPKILETLHKAGLNASSSVNPLGNSFVHTQLKIFEVTHTDTRANVRMEFMYA